MNKDALLATAIGFFIGLAITGLLLVGPTLMSKIPKIQVSLPELPKTQPKSAKSTPPPASDQLTIDSPLNESIESKNEVLVSGVAPQQATIVIQGPLNDAVATTQSERSYAGTISLVEGKNEISVTAHTKQGSQTQTITVFFTQSEL